MRTRGLGARHDERRADILAAVLAVAAESGIGALSQAAVAARAGVSPGRVQHYYPTKDVLLAAAFDAANRSARARIRDLVGAELSDAPARRVLEVVLTELIPHDDVSRAHLQFRQSYASLALHHGGVASELRERYRVLHQQDLADLLRRDQDAGRITTDVDPVAVAIRLAALAEGLAYYVLLAAVSADAARREVLDDIARLYT